jgi:uncharacterized membrane protein YgdD (TMEM256/DUF423 family)
MEMPTAPNDGIQAVYQRRWIAGFLAVGFLLFAGGCWRRHLDRGNPENDQPVMAEMVSSKVVLEDSTFYITGIARYTVQGRKYDSSIDDLDGETNRASIERRQSRYAPTRQIQVYYDPKDPQSIRLRRELRHETLWGLVVALLGGSLLFTGSVICPINSYNRWMETRAPDWVDALGYYPLLAALVPVVVLLIFLFNRYFILG